TRVEVLRLRRPRNPPLPSPFEAFVPETVARPACVRAQEPIGHHSKKSARCRRGGANKDARDLPEWGRAEWSRPQSPGRKSISVSTSAAWPSAPGFRFGIRRWCQRAASTRKSWDRSAVVEPGPPAARAAPLV